MPDDKKVYYVDIDETICITPDNPRDYSKSVPIKENIEKINRLYDAGHRVVYWTVRGSRTGKDQILPTLEQLTSWGAKFHQLSCTKPYYDVFIDDRTIRIEELDG